MPTSPRFPQTQGFVSLSTKDSHGTAEAETDIPLAPMRSNVSFGARRPNQGGVLGSEEFGLSRSSGSFGSPDEKRQAGISAKSSVRQRTTPGGRRRVVKREEPSAIRRRGTLDSEVALNFMGKLYTRVVGYSAVTRYLIYVLPVALLLAIPIVLLPVTGHSNSIPLGHVTTNATTVPPTRVAGPPLFKLFIWIEAAWASLWAAKVVAHLLPFVFMFFCGVISSGTRKYATVLRSLEIPFSLFIWGLASWLVFKGLFPDDRFTWVRVLKDILGSLFVSSAVFLGEKAIVQLISITYHQRSFANRIHESKHEIYLLGLMYDASRALFPMYCREMADEDYAINDSIGIDNMLVGGGGASRLGHGSGGDHGQPGGRHRKTASVNPMRLIGNVGRFGDKVTSAFGSLATEITGKKVFNPNSAHSVVVEALERVRSSEALARRIWMSFAVEDRDALSLDDVEEVLGPAHKDEAAECFAALDADGNGDISLDEMVRKVVEMGKERKAIANSMKDISQALAVFDSVLLFVVLLIVIFIFLAFFQSSFIQTLATAGTALLSLSFAFAVTTQEFLGSCIFLFVKHPYDVGDRVDITGPEKEQLVVERISLLYTVFVRIDRMQVVQVPNIVLNGLWIENVTRSRAMSETLDLNVSYDTSFADLELLRLEMERFVRHPDNARDFQPDIKVTVAGVGDLDKLQLKIAIKHKSNWHNDAVRATRRNKFMCALAQALKTVPIYNPGGGNEALGAPGNPSYSVAVSDAVAEAARQKAAKAKDAKRLVPLLQAEAKDKEEQAALLADGHDHDHDHGHGHGHDQADARTLRSRVSFSSLHPGPTAPSLLAPTQSRRGLRQAGQGLAADVALAGEDGEDGGDDADVAALRQQPSHQHHTPMSRFASSASRRRGDGSTYTSIDLERGPSNATAGTGSTTGMMGSPPPLPSSSQMHPLQNAPISARSQRQ